MLHPYSHSTTRRLYGFTFALILSMSAGVLEAVGGTLPAPEAFTGVVLGEPPADGSVEVATNGMVEVRARGAGLGGRLDGGYFAFGDGGTNDFDVRVRVVGWEPTALSARAGLMVREATAGGAVMAAIVATPGMNGVQFVSRGSADGSAVVVGSFPVNFPYTWLRLQRSNDVFRGLASRDGRRWTAVGKASLTLTNTLVGVAASSAQTGVTGKAVFADWSEVTQSSEDPVAPVAETPGPSSRRTSLAITEINYNPPRPSTVGEAPTQFIEVFNSDFTAKELGGHRLEADTLRYVFPTNFVLAAGGYVVVAKDPATLKSFYAGISPDQVLGPWEGDLRKDHDTVRLWSPFGALLLEVPYLDQSPWPAAADGEGHTLVLARPSWGESDPRAWSASPEHLGSPGRMDAWDGDPRAGLRIMEVLAPSAGGGAPFVELFNAGTDPAPLEGGLITGPIEGAQPLLKLPAKVLAPGERVVVEVPGSVTNLPSPLFVRQGEAGRVWDVVEFGGAAAGIPLGRVNVGRSELRRLAVATPGEANAAFRRPRVVISEVMYRPITGRDDDQYLEIWNPGSEAVSLSGWRLKDGVTFEFPANRSLGPGERAVLARNSARLRLTYPRLEAGRIWGEFGGRLGAGGERLTLVDATGGVEFGFTYRSGGEWPALADGGGSSLELLHPDLDPDVGANWGASDETQRATWGTYEVKGLLEGGTGSITDVRVLLLGEGETLVDDAEVLTDAGTNLLANSNFENGQSGWLAGGTHDQSGLWTEGGFGGSAQALRLRALGRGDNGINSVRSAVRTGLRAGTNATLRLRARWLAGTRDLLFRLKGNYLELPVRLEVPEDLGTPGAANSRSLAAARPVLTDLAHDPVLPAEGQSVRVTVRISGESGGARPVLRYRLDPSAELAEPVPMNDAGVDGDRVAGDGVYTAWLPGMATRTMAAFHVTLGPEGEAFRLPRTTPGREALVRWGETQPAGNLGVYRIWITRATESRWTSRAKLHNGDLDATFVYGSSRAVYGAGTLYSGSPFVSPGYNGPAGGTLCGYVLHFPEDDRVLGETDFVMDWPIRDDTRQLEQRAYEFGAEIGLPYLHRRFVHMYVNSARRGTVYEDTQQPGSAYLKNWSPDDNDGNLHKIEDWFEFAAAGDMEVNTDAYLQDFRRSDGTRNMARYRWNFRPRSVQGSAHDFSALYRLVDAAARPSYLLDYQRELEREMDVDEWAGVFALEHAVGNWDSFGYSRGKNMFAYRPERGPWKLYIWDIDFVMSASGEGPGNWAYSTIDGTISALYQYPTFQRAYWRAVKKLVNGPMRPERFTARTEAVRQGLLENGLTAGNVTAARNWVRDQRTSLLGQLADLDKAFTLETGLQNGATTDPVLRLQGEGPVEMTGLRVGGEIVPVLWFTTDRWMATVPLPAGRSTLTIAPVDRAGRTLANTRAIVANLTQPAEPDSRRLVINEVHVRPQFAGAGFVELFNPSLAQTVDLSGLQLVGSGVFEFPPNTTLAPNQFLVLGNSLAAFQAEFGRTQFPTVLLPWAPGVEGETLAVVRPVSGTNPAVTVTAVTYRPDGPWPSTTPGRSLQLRDASRGEDDRVGAWGVYVTSTNTSPWKEFSVSGVAGGTNLLVYISSFPGSVAPGDLVGRWVGSLSTFAYDFAAEFTRGTNGTLAGRFFGGDVSVDPERFSSALAGVSQDTNGAIRFTWTDLNGRFVGRIDATGSRATGTFTFDGGSSPFSMTRQRPAGTALVDGLRLTREGEDANLLRNGGFDEALGAEWALQGGHAGSLREETTPAGGVGNADYSLRVVAQAGGNGTPTNAVSQAVAGVVPGATYRLSGLYQAVQAQGLIIGLEGGPTFMADLRPRTAEGADATPGRPNSVATALDPVALVWINEVQPENSEGSRDAAGQAEPWLELHNSGTEAAPLDGYWLSDDPLAPEKWAFPPGSQVPAGGFLVVWLDGETAQGSVSAPHAAFRPTPRDGVVVLSRRTARGLQTVDFLHYAAVPPGRSFGHLPEAWVHSDQVLPQATPGAPNGVGAGASQVWINEWMATNDGSVRDPADQDSDDWFELYNPGAAAVELGGWYLSDSATNPLKFQVPAGYRVPPGGFLLVWADEESGQNQSARPDLHVNFRLSGGGEEILLSRPDGTVVDHVVFGAQTSGVSNGRQPDGTPGTNYVVLARATPGAGNASLPPVSPDILALGRLGGVLRVSFTAEPGARYRLRMRPALEQAWVPTTATVTSTGTQASLDWPIDDAPQRFLQVERVP